MEYAIWNLAQKLNSYNGSLQHDNQQFIILNRRFRDFKTTWYNNRTMEEKDAIRNYAIRLSDPNGVRYMGLSSDTLATEWKINLWRDKFGFGNPQDGSGRRKRTKRKSRKRRKTRRKRRTKRRTKRKSRKRRRKKK